MAEPIDYYFTSLSPFSYLGHRALIEMSERTGAAINFKPVKLMELWAQSGAVPPGQRPEVRQRYRILELQRVALFRNVCLNVKPAHFPTDPSIADLSICAIVASGGDPAGFAEAVGRALWQQDEQIADEAVISRILADTGHDADTVMAAASTDEISAIRDANTASALAADAVGAPAYVYKGEVFWGQDRLEYLEQMIATGRDAYPGSL